MLQLTCLYLERLASESLEPLLCTMTKKIAGKTSFMLYSAGNK